MSVYVCAVALLLYVDEWGIVGCMTRREKKSALMLDKLPLPSDRAIQILYEFFRCMRFLAAGDLELAIDAASPAATSVARAGRLGARHRGGAGSWRSHRAGTKAPVCPAFELLEAVIRPRPQVTLPGRERRVDGTRKGRQKEGIGRR
jgi:hypothetical protein